MAHHQTDLCGFIMKVIAAPIEEQIPPQTRALRALLSTLQTEWKLNAACRGQDPNLFFFSSKGGGRDAGEARKTQEATAKAICAGCTVRQECLEYALRLNEKEGIWGGLTWEERKALPQRKVS